jgi:hypothetical protein
MFVEVHIAVHRLERLSYLDQAIEFLAKWDDDVYIIIHSNSPCPEKYKNFNWNHYITLIHPYELTWKCMEYIKNRDLTSDAYIYMEDDIGIPKETFEYWKKYQVPHIGIIRQTLNGRCDDIFELDQFYVKNDCYHYKKGAIYKACWINTREQMLKYIYDFDTILENEILKNLDWSRERAAYGNTMTKLAFIPVNEIENCRVFHLDSRKYDKGPFVKDLFANVENGST